MKNFEFPQIFKPIVGELNPDSYISQYFQDDSSIKLLKTTRQLMNQQKKTQMQPKTVKTLTSKSVKDFSLLPERINLQPRFDVTSQRYQGYQEYQFKENEMEGRNKLYVPIKKKKVGAVRFQNNQQMFICTSRILTSQKQSNKSFKKSQQYSDKRNMTQMGQNIPILIYKQDIELSTSCLPKQRDHQKKRPSIEDSYNIIRRKKLNNQKSKKDIKSMKDSQNQHFRKNSKLQPLHYLVHQLVHQLEKNISNKVIDKSQKSTHQIPENQCKQDPAETYQNRINSIKTIELQNIFSEKMESQKQFFQSTFRIKSIASIGEDQLPQAVAQKNLIKKSYLKRLNTVHVLDFQRKQEEFPYRRIDKKSFPFHKSQITQQSIEDEEINMRKKNSKYKKVTFYEFKADINNKQNNQLIQGAQKIERHQKRKKLILKMKQSQTSIDIGSQILPENTNNKNRTYFFRQNKRKPRKASIRLQPLNQDVYNQLNLLLMQIANLKNNNQIQEPENTLFPQILYTSVGEGLNQRDQERIQNSKKQNMMIDFGVKMTKGNKLRQVPA